MAQHLEKRVNSREEEEERVQPTTELAPVEKEIENGKTMGEETERGALSMTLYLIVNSI